MSCRARLERGAESSPRRGLTLTLTLTLIGGAESSPRRGRAPRRARRGCGARATDRGRRAAASLITITSHCHRCVSVGPVPGCLINGYARRVRPFCLALTLSAASSKSTSSFCCELSLFRLSRIHAALTMSLTVSSGRRNHILNISLLSDSRGQSPWMVSGSTNPVSKSWLYHKRASPGESAIFNP